MVASSTLYFFGYILVKDLRRKPLSLVFRRRKTLFTDKVWHNALVRYNIEKNRKEWPRLKGTLPYPRAGAAVSLQGSYAYIFGGRCKQRRLNDLICIDLSTMTSTMIDPGGEPDPFASPKPFLPSP